MLRNYKISSAAIVRESRQAPSRNRDFLQGCDLAYLEEGFVCPSVKQSRPSKGWPHLRLGKLRKECGKEEGRGRFLMGQLLASVWTLGKLWCKCSSPWRGTRATGTMVWKAAGNSQVTPGAAWSTGSRLCPNMSWTLRSLLFNLPVQFHCQRGACSQGDFSPRERKSFLHCDNQSHTAGEKKPSTGTPRQPLPWLLTDSSYALTYNLIF